ncbi:hypothetical protein [Streptomyces cyaneofuscatus]|uniref:hypothetical protein n=1 Tax=Streptomyces cyaneofuscatus TaxID=66883 RepID=UPI0036DE463D
MAWRPPLDLGLCSYQTNGFTEHEVKAIEEYDAKLTLATYFDLEELLAEHPGLDVESAMRHRGGELALWHTELNGLMADPRLENARRRTPACPDGPPFDTRGRGPYAAAVFRYLSFAAQDYHRHCRGLEHTATVRALGLQAPGTYPPLTTELDLVNRRLKEQD